MRATGNKSVSTSRGMRLLFLALIQAAARPAVGVTVRGAGASFPNEVYESWMPAFEASRLPFVHLQMTYDAIGSSAGKSLIMDPGGEIEYAGTDTPLTEREEGEFPDLVTLPSMAGAVVLAFNLPGIQSINLTRQHLVGIYNGTYRQWNDPDIQTWNPDVSLPPQNILVVARSESSGTTEIFTLALSAFDPEWAKHYGHFNDGLDQDDNPIHWNNSVISWYGRTNRGVSGLVLSLRYSIAYLSIADAIESNLNYANLVNKEGYVVQATQRSAQSAMDALATESEEALVVDLVDAPGMTSYPIVGYTNIIVHLTQMRNCDSAKELFRYIGWFSRDPIAHSACREIGFAPLSELLADRIDEKVLAQMFCHGESVALKVEDDRRAEEISLQTWRTPVIVSGVIACVLIATASAFVLWQQFRTNRALIKGEWRIPESQVVFIENYARSRQSGATSLSESTAEHKVNLDPKNGSESQGMDGRMSGGIHLGRFGEKLCTFHRLSVEKSHNLSLSARRSLLRLRDDIHHSNVADFYGVCDYEEQAWLVTEFCTKGTLHDIIQDSRYNIDANFKFSMVSDVAEGMKYLHGKAITHGNLSTSTCYIDSRWNVKVSNWAYTKLAQCQKNDGIWAMPVSLDNDLVSDPEILARRQLWLAPELLTLHSQLPTKECDIYAFALILIEVFSREDPYDKELVKILPSAVVKQVRESGIRPQLPRDYPNSIRQLTEFCWDTIPTNRPPFKKILKRLKAAKPTKKGVLDCMMEAVEQYVQHLEDRVEERTHELNTAMADMAALLHKMLPPSVASKLSRGESVPPEHYDSVTVFFSDVVGFTAISAMSTPMEIITLLNELYTTFDTIVDQHDVYKVETIGDAYMVISGLPVRNGKFHASHVCSMALDLLVAVGGFRIPHMPGETLKLRAGIHSGPVVAGVVGHKMPRYCLFGDTVNTASRMESTSLALKIQISEATQDILKDDRLYVTQDRGDVAVKGKGTMRTYWLLGKNGMMGVLPEALVEEV